MRWASLQAAIVSTVCNSCWKTLWAHCITACSCKFLLPIFFRDLSQLQHTLPCIVDGAANSLRARSNGGDAPASLMLYGAAALAERDLFA